MANEITLKTGLLSNLPTTKTPGQLLFAHNGTSGSIFLDIDKNTRIKFNADALKIDGSDVTINDTLFDGSSSIVTKIWGESRNFTIGSTTRAVNGEEITGYTWTHADIGAVVGNSWTAGTNAGPSLTVTVNGVSAISTIPTANTEQSGIITNALQTIGGAKYFRNAIVAENDERNPSYYFKPTKADKILGEIQLHGYNASISSNIDDVSYRFRNYSYTQNTNTVLAHYEEFYLPSVDPNRTGSASYEIFTSKNFNSLDDRYINTTGDIMLGTLQLEDDIIAYQGYTAMNPASSTADTIKGLLIKTDELVGKIDFVAQPAVNTWRFYQISVNNSGNNTGFGRYYVLPNAPKNLSADEYVNIISSAGGTVDGTLVLAKTQTASGTANNSPALIVGGTSTTQHLEFDGNSIMSKTNGTTAGTLSINENGGKIFVGGHLEAVHPTGGEISLRAVYGENKYFYLYGNNSTGVRGMYDTTKGAVIKVEDTKTTFYGDLDGNAKSASALTVSAGSTTLPVYFENGIPKTISNLWLGGTGDATYRSMGIIRKNSNDASYQNIQFDIENNASASNIIWSHYSASSQSTTTRGLTLSTTAIVPSGNLLLDFGAPSQKLNNIYAGTLHGNLNWSYLTNLPATYAPHLYIHNAIGTAGTDGYIKFATITISGTYKNAPVVIELSKRQKTLSSVLYLTFANANSTDPGFGSFKFTGEDYECYIHKSATSTWDLYCKKAEGYDQIGVIRYHRPLYMGNNVSVTWTDTQVSTYPDGAIKAVAGGLTDKLGTGRNLTIGNAVEVFDGSKNLEWTANEIGLMSLSQVGTLIPDGTDLNTIVTPGNYYTPTAESSESLINGPNITNAAIRLVVMTHYGSNNTNYIKQFAFGPSETIYIRVKSFSDDQTSGAWGGWRGLGLVEETGILPISEGGTGANNAQDALINLNGVSYTVVTDLSTLL